MTNKTWALAFLGAAAIISLNVWAAHRDSQGMKCYPDCSVVSPN